jgi:hypothetical protein
MNVTYISQVTVEEEGNQEFQWTGQGCVVAQDPLAASNQHSDVLKPGGADSCF